MPFLGTEQINPVDADASSSTKALKKALKAKKKMAQENGNSTENMTVDQSVGENTTKAQETMSHSSLLGARSSKLTIAQCPSRLTSYLPPPNYGTVERGAISRSGFPKAKNLEFLESLNIRSILSLVDTEPCEDFHRFMDMQGIQRNHLSIAANKDGGQMEHKSICDAIIFAKEPTNQPVHIHCNQGKHRTGCVVACLRKYQGRPMEEILIEYKAYAYPKERPGDIEFIKAFDPKMVDAYAKWYAHSGISPKSLRVDSKLDIWELCASIPNDYPGVSLSESSMSSSYDSNSDIMMRSPLLPSREGIMATFTTVRDFGSPGGKNIKHDNEAGICTAEIVHPSTIGSFDVGDGDSDWEETETIAFSSTATSPAIACAARSTLSSCGDGENAHFTITITSGPAQS